MTRCGSIIQRPSCPEVDTQKPCPNRLKGLLVLFSKWIHLQTYFVPADSGSDPRQYSYISCIVIIIFTKFFQTICRFPLSAGLSKWSRCRVAKLCRRFAPQLPDDYKRCYFGQNRVSIKSVLSYPFDLTNFRLNELCEPVYSSLLLLFLFLFRADCIEHFLSQACNDSGSWTLGH